MRTIFLAAGVGSRIRSATAGAPKCLLEFAGATLLEHAIRSVKACGISDIVVLSGYRPEQIERILPKGVRNRIYDDFEFTNNLGTLAASVDLLDTEVLIAFADVFMDLNGWTALVDSGADTTLLIDRSRIVEGTMRIRETGTQIVDIGSHIPVSQGDGSFTGLAKFRARSSALLAERILKLNRSPNYGKSHYTEAVREIILDGHEVVGLNIAGLRWEEVDTPEDYRRLLQAIN
jgi:L-glutamine-phosphate cytidylyltransferase